MMDLICFPFAGGTEHAYDFIHKDLPSSIHLRQFSSPGKGSRAIESHVASFEDLVETYFDQLTFDREYVLFGHSMGALLAHCILDRIIREHKPLPLCLIVSGKEGPSQHRDRKRYDFSEEDLSKLLTQLGLVSGDLLEDPHLRKNVLEPFRKDLVLLDSWPKRFFRKHDVPVHFLYGQDDQLGEQAVASWQMTTTTNFSFQAFEGGHFYYLKQREMFVNALVGIIREEQLNFVPAF